MGSRSSKALYKSKLPNSMLLRTQKKRIWTTVSRSNQKKDLSLSGREIVQNCLNMAKFIEYTYLEVFGGFLSPMNTDLFLDWFVGTVVQIRFFWVQRSLQSGQLQICLIKGLRWSGPLQYRHFHPFLGFLVFSAHFNIQKGPKNHMTVFKIPT